MKLLLTSAGLTNDALQKKFLALLGKSPSDSSLALVETAARGDGNASWVKNDAKKLEALGVGKVSQIDIAEPQEKWMNILKSADVIFVDGGNTFYLLDKIRSSGLDETLIEITKDKLYVGVSSGSILVTPNIAIAKVEPADANRVGMTDFTGLNWVDFEISPHTPSSVSLENIERYTSNLNRKLYAIDDNSAVAVLDDKVEFVGTGFTKIY